jgi:fatty-acyl-CoA synthase
VDVTADSNTRAIVGAAPEALWFEPLTPTAFLERSGSVWATRVAVVDDQRTFTYRELDDRSRRLAGALRGLGVAVNDRVAVLAPNTHVLLEAHYGVPLAGAVLVALNTRLTAADVTRLVAHSGAGILIVDETLAGLAHEAVTAVAEPVRMIVAGAADSEYETLLGDAPRFAARLQDEHGLLAIDYTSGTTGRNKGVMYHHRGAYLQSLAMALHAGLGPDTVFLWTLPMFHCNGWCFPWAVTAAGGRHVCLRRVDPAVIWRLIVEQGVTHLNAAPTVLSDLAYHPDAVVLAKGSPLRVCTGGAPPSPTLLARLAQLGVSVTHLYGLTETYGPIVICDWDPAWDALAPDDAARIKARQGVGNVVSQPVRVLAADGQDVAADGQTIGEITVRGNNLMLGYWNEPAETAAALTADGWFHTGDLAVMHPDGYVEVRDRAKDIIISGGENIASIEVEQALASHPAVLEVAVVPVPDDRWGERPAAFVTLRSGQTATEAELIAYARSLLAGFKAPREVTFGPLPKTSTGKIQKFILRDQARARERETAPARPSPLA